MLISENIFLLKKLKNINTVNASFSKGGAKDGVPYVFKK